MRSRRPFFSLLVLSLMTMTCVSPAARADETEREAEAVSDLGRIEFHGYGDIHYNNPGTGTMSRGASNEIDVHRLELGWEYKFTPALRAEGEVDFEHAATEIEMEEAVIEYDLAPALSLRVGSLLMPVGPFNEAHEPALYYSVERPYVQQSLIPTTWQEGGLGLAGQAAGRRLAYRAYLTAGLDATRFGSLDGIRGGRGHAAESKANDLAGVARIEASPARELSFGASGYYGGADQRTPGLGQVGVAILDVDARYQRGGADLRGVLTWTGVNGAGRVSTLVGETVGRQMLGWYLEGAYDLIGRGRPRRGGGAGGSGGAGQDGRALFLFARAERVDTNNRVPSGHLANPSADRRILTTGVSYRPIEKVAFKADLEHWTDRAGATLNRLNLGAAFMF